MGEALVLQVSSKSWVKMTPESSSDGLIFENFLGVGPQTPPLQSMLTSMLCCANCCLLEASNLLIFQMYWTPVV